VDKGEKGSRRQGEASPLPMTGRGSDGGKETIGKIPPPGEKGGEKKTFPIKGRKEPIPRSFEGMPKMKKCRPRHLFRQRREKGVRHSSSGASEGDMGGVFSSHCCVGEGDPQIHRRKGGRNGTILLGQKAKREKKKKKSGGLVIATPERKKKGIMN